MAIATFLCLFATGIGLTGEMRWAPLALTVFAFAWLTFYVSIAIPIKLKKREARRDES